MNTFQPTVNWVKNRVRQSRDDQQQLFDAGLNGLKLVKREGKEIELDSGERLTEFLSCSYLGLECDPRLIHGAVSAPKPSACSSLRAEPTSCCLPCVSWMNN